MIQKLFHFDKDNPRSPWIFYIFYFVVFFGNAIQGSFLSVYLNEQGIPAATISLLNGILQLCSLVFLPIMGRIADNAPTKNRIMTIGYLVMIFFLFMFTQVQNLFIICVLRIMYGLLSTPLMSIYETITFDSITKKGWEYQPIRMSGTIGFSIMALVSGYLLKGDIGTIFPIMIAGYALTIVIGLFMPTSRRVEKPADESKKAEKKAGTSVYSLLKKRKIRNVLILFFIYSLSSSMNNNFFSLYARSLGGDLKLMGFANAILGFSELPFHLGPGKRWLKRLGVEKSQLVVLAVGVFRWIICAITKNATVLMWTMVLNGIMLVPSAIGMAEFLYDEAPEGLKVTAQTSLRSSVSVAAMLVADFGGSLLIKMFTHGDVVSYGNIYLILVPISIAGLIIGWTSIKKGEKEEALAAAAAGAEPAE